MSQAQRWQRINKSNPYAHLLPSADAQNLLHLITGLHALKLLAVQQLSLQYLKALGLARLPGLNKGLGHAVVATAIAGGHL